MVKGQDRRAARQAAACLRSCKQPENRGGAACWIAALSLPSDDLTCAAGRQNCTARWRIRRPYRPGLPRCVFCLLFRSPDTKVMFFDRVGAILPGEGARMRHGRLWRPYDERLNPICRGLAWAWSSRALATVAAQVFLNASCAQGSDVGCCGRNRKLCPRDRNRHRNLDVSKCLMAAKPRQSRPRHWPGPLVSHPHHVPHECRPVQVPSAAILTPASCNRSLRMRAMAVA